MNAHSAMCTVPLILGDRSDIHSRIRLRRLVPWFVDTVGAAFALLVLDAVVLVPIKLFVSFFIISSSK